MSNNEDNFSTNVGILKYRLDELEKLVKPLIDLVNNLDKKVSLLTQKNSNSYCNYRRCISVSWYLVWFPFSKSTECFGKCK